MNVIEMNTKLGIIWYTARNFRQIEVHVVCYGLQVKQFDSRKMAEAEFAHCMNHAEGVK